MKKILYFIDTWGLRIVFVLTLFIFLKTCNTNSKIQKVEKRIDSLNNVVQSTNLSIEKLSNKLQLEIKIEGLKSEKRMIQSTDRKILDVNRQSEIDKEIEELSK